MQNVYAYCPRFEGERFVIRQISQDDCEDLLRVYSDERSVPLFNSDNCHGDDFHYTTMEHMRGAIEFWFYSYIHQYFVRWAVVDRVSGEAIGTIELFRREADDWFTDCGILRLDLRSDYEQTDTIRDILALIVPEACEMFDCSMIATKAVPAATERISALEEMGFAARAEKLIGHDSTEYGDYYALFGEKENGHE